LFVGKELITNLEGRGFSIFYPIKIRKDKKGEWENQVP
jgi:hypothetical protein